MLNVHNIDWREHVGRAVLDPTGPRGEPISTPTDRRMLWELLSRFGVLVTTPEQRDTLTVLRAYLYDTCGHHFNDSTDYDDRPLRQCLWCNRTEWLIGASGGGEPCRYVENPPDVEERP